MRIQVIDNVVGDMLTTLSSAIGDTQDVRIAVAFISRAGLAMIDSALKLALDRGATVEFLVGLDMRSTDPQALETLYSVCSNHPTAAMYCYASLTPAGIYHPKLYLFKVDQDATCIIGSSNLTEGGLKKNVEVNAIIEGTTSDEAISDAYNTYNRLKFHPKRVVPDEEFLNLYRQLCQTEASLQARASSDANMRGLVKAFNQKTQSMRRPAASERDLLGWLELVYRNLPAGDFTNEQVYGFEEAFQRHYPDNLNIRAKVRQQLQVLRDMGMIEHMGTGRWRKI